MVERSAGIGSWRLALPGRQVLYSSQCAAILALAPGTALTLDALVERFTPEGRERIKALLQACSQDAAGFDEEILLETPADHLLGRQWVRLVGETVRGDAGQLIGLQGTLQDISAQKQAQSETLRLTMRLTTTLASITEAFVTLDRQCCFTYLNQESERLLQRPAAELLGREVWQDIINGVGQRLRHQLQNALATNRRVEFEDFYPGLGKWLEVRAYPFAEGLAVYFRDVTERRKSQEQLMLLETSISRLNDIVLIAEAVPERATGPASCSSTTRSNSTPATAASEVLGQTPRLLLGPRHAARRARTHGRQPCSRSSRCAPS